MNFLNTKKIKSISILFLFLVVISCNSKPKRYIDPQDKSYSEDVRSISERINKSPQNADLYYKRSNTFFFEDKFKDAIEDINIAIELKPNSGFYYFKLAEYYMAGDTADAKSAEKAYLKSIELSPDQEEVHLKYAVLLLAKQRYKETVEQLTAILNVNSSNADALFFLGMVNKETGDTAQAVKRFQETAEANNSYYNAYMQLAFLLMEDEPQMALSYIDNAIRVDEFSDEAHYTKGLILEERGEYIAAKEFYKRTVELNPNHRFAYYRLAYINADIDNNLIKTLDYLDKLITIDPEFVSGLHFRSAVYKRLKMYERAHDDLTKALQIDPQNEEIKSEIQALEEFL